MALFALTRRLTLLRPFLPNDLKSLRLWFNLATYKLDGVWHIETLKAAPVPFGDFAIFADLNLLFEATIEGQDLANAIKSKMAETNNLQDYVGMSFNEWAISLGVNPYQLFLPVVVK